MAYCNKCGAQISEQAAFCSQCGAPQKVSAPTPPPTPRPAHSGLAENTAATLSYALGWLTGIIFLLVDKRPFVRFHAAQSIVVFGGLHIIHHIVALIVGARFLTGGWPALAPGVVVLHLISAATFLLWILLMVKAHQRERFKIPVAWEIAEGMVGK